MPGGIVPSNYRLANLPTALHGDIALKRALAELTGAFHGRRAGEVDGWQVVNLGSAFTLRVLGGFAGDGDLPLRARVRFVGDRPESRLELELESREGWHVARLPDIDVKYARRMDAIVRGLEAALRVTA